MKLIEVTCTGNNGRSVIAESVGNQRVKEQDLEGRILFISSGTRADSKHDEHWPYAKAVMMINKAAEAGLLEGMKVDEARYNSDEEYRIIASQYARKSLEILRPIEAAMRTAALFRCGLEYSGTRTQTAPRDDVSLILGINDSITKQIREIYKDIKNPPEIDNLSRYAGVEEELPDCLGKLNITPYLSLVEKCREIMPKVIERFRGEYDV